MKRMVKCSPEQAVDAGRAALDGGINVVRDAQLSCEPLMWEREEVSISMNIYDDDDDETYWDMWTLKPLIILFLQHGNTYAPQAEESRFVST